MLEATFRNHAQIALIARYKAPLDPLPRLCYNLGMKENAYTVLRIRAQTHKKLRLIAALSDEQMIDTMERLATQELARLKEQERQREQEP
jgi:hypothetical protein